ncbi:hypothetical protein B0A50_08270 [Salinomyces thailandicus]|uniref:CCHC-type domain-containing protein n=1 Tax=Salinomyces thailandicus TaxID=706561 RepID=A0A4U0TKG6_9PEZI|nr:hypothetical protein B0A50_08270 [Salinomyces thailandica]
MSQDNPFRGNGRNNKKGKGKQNQGQGQGQHQRPDALQQQSKPGEKETAGPPAWQRLGFRPDVSTTAPIQPAAAPLSTKDGNALSEAMAQTDIAGPKTRGKDAANFMGASMWGHEDEEEDDGEGEVRDTVPEALKRVSGLEARAPFISREKVVELEPHQKVLSTDQLPSDIDRFPTADKDLYPDHLSGIYNEFRGQDIPIDEDMEVVWAEGKKSRIDGNNASVEVHVHNTGEDDVMLSTIANPPPGQDKALDTRCIKLVYQMHSQVPGFTLLINKRGDDEQGNKKNIVFFRYFANMLRKGASIETDGSVAICTELGKNLKHAHSSNEGQSLMGLWVALPPSTNFAPEQADHHPTWGAPSSRPLITGVGRDEIMRLVETAKRAEKWGNSTLSIGDWALVGLFLANELSIFRYWKDDEAPKKVWERFDRYWTAAMSDAGIHGNFPYYRRQARRQGREISDRQFRMTIDKCPPPRHMVLKWRGTYDQGNLVGLLPEQWDSFPDSLFYPDAESKAFAVRLGVERGRDFGKAQIRYALNAKQGALSGRFDVFPPRMGPNIYWLDVNVDNVSGSGVKALFGENRKSRPAAHTRITVTIKEEGHPLHLQELKGTIQEDLWGRDPSIAAVVRARPDLPRCTGPPGQNEFTVPVEVELDDDGTPSDRQNAALCELAKGIERTDGVDLSRLVLRATSTIEDQDKIHRDVADVSDHRAAYAEIVSGSRLNVQQAFAANTAFQQAFLLLHGPPGTGKTRTELAIARGHVEVGRSLGQKRRIFACAPSNKAVDNMVDGLIAAFGGNKDRMKQSLHICRFKGGRVNPGHRTKRNTNALAENATAERERGHDGDDQDEMESSIWDLCDFMANKDEPQGHHLEFYFQRQRRRYIRSCSTDESCPYHSEALHYCDALRESRKATASTVAKKDAKQVMKEADDVWDARYFDEEVDIVFCTNSAAAHSTLMDHFKPSVLVSDEAALASLADVVTPMAAFKESLVTVVLGGDHKQQGPPALSRGGNETLKELLRTLFVTLQDDENCPGKVDLQIQHRMQPAIADMVSKIWYGDRLRGHESLEEETPLRVTLKEAWAYLTTSGCSNSRLRLGVNVSGQATQRTVEGSVSLCNDAEAEFVLAYVEYLLQFTPSRRPEGQLQGRKVEESDILIITPYAGQVSLIKQRLYHDKRNDIQVVTSAGVQGRESPIVLLSLVRNKPDSDEQLLSSEDSSRLHVGFIAQSTQLCVNFSRAREHQVTFANWEAWIKAWKAGHPWMVRGRGHHWPFAQVVQDHLDRKDIVEMSHFQSLLSKDQSQAAAPQQSEAIWRTIGTGDEIRAQLATQGVGDYNKTCNKCHQPGHKSANCPEIGHLANECLTPSTPAVRRATAGQPRRNNNAFEAFREERDGPAQRLGIGAGEKRNAPETQAGDERPLQRHKEDDEKEDGEKEDGEVGEEAPDVDMGLD